MALQRDYHGQECSVARTLEIVGERWTLLILREAFMGVRRFDEMQVDLGVARNILDTRLRRLVEHGILERVPYQERPLRHEYRLTDSGRDLWPALVSLMAWGDRHLAGDAGPPVLLEHRGCGGAVDEHRICVECGARLGPRDVWALPGPGARRDHPLRRRDAASASS